jgi:hypothetical protein
MKISNFSAISFLFIAMLLLFSVDLFAQNYGNLKNLDWLSGTWISETETQILKEHWEKVSSNTFEGIGKTINKKSKTENFESLRLMEMSGEIFYLAKVATNNLPVAFKLTSKTDSTLVFENPDHDFPKQITYIRENESSMHVVVGEGEKSFKIIFHRE